MFWRFGGAFAPGTLTVSRNWWELVDAPAASTDGASAGELIELNVGKEEPSSPSLPAAATMIFPALAAFSKASALRSQGTPAGLPQAAPVASGPVKAGPPEENEMMSIPSLTASSSAWMMTSSNVESLTSGDP